MKTITVKLTQDMYKKLKKRAKQLKVSEATLLAKVFEERIDYSDIDMQLDSIIDDALYSEESVMDIETRAEEIYSTVE